MRSRIATLCSLAGLTLCCAIVGAQEAPEAATADVAATAVPAPASAPSDGQSGVRRAVIVCGLAGDADHRELFAESIELLVTGLTTHHGFNVENVELYWGDEVT